MGSSEFCRICTKSTKNVQFKRLFERNKSNLVKQIQAVTGVILENSKQLPQHICKPCEDDLAKASEFRLRCLFAQEYFNTAEYKETQSHALTGAPMNTRSSKNEIKDELPIDVDHIAEFCFVKEEFADEFLRTDIEHDYTIDSFNDDDDDDDDAEDRLVVNSKTIVESKLDVDEGGPNDSNDMKLNTITIEFRKKAVKKSKPARNKIQKLTREKNSIVIAERKKLVGGKRKVRGQSFICDQCGNHFTCRNHFKTHLRRHTGDKQFQCEVCPNKFFTQSEVNRHMRKHTGERPFQCKHCGRRFTDYSTRIKHERTHTNERPFVCGQCSKAFTTSYILKNHMLVHTGERSFRCELCNKAFQRQVHLAVHCRSITHKQNEEKKKQNIGATPEQLDDVPNELLKFA